MTDFSESAVFVEKFFLFNLENSFDEHIFESFAFNELDEIVIHVCFFAFFLILLNDRNNYYHD